MASVFSIRQASRSNDAAQCMPRRIEADRTIVSVPPFQACLCSETAASGIKPMPAFCFGNVRSALRPLLSERSAGLPGRMMQPAARDRIPPFVSNGAHGAERLTKHLAVMLRRIDHVGGE